MRRLKSAALTACLMLAPATPALAEGDPRPGFMDFITPDAIVQSVANIAISALRTVMEVEYAHMHTDILRGAVTFSGVTLRPQLPYDLARQCEITIERAGFDFGNPVQDLNAWNVSATLMGVRAGAACVERDVALGLRMAGYSELTVDRLLYETDYIHSTGEIRITASATVQDLATLDLEMAGAVLPRLSPYGGAGDPALRLRKAVLGVQDHGGWQRLSALIPENLRDPDVIRGLGTEALTDMLGQGGSRALSATERRFVDDLMAHVADFVRAPGEITLEADLPASGVVLEPEVYQAPQELLQALAPDARTAPLARGQLIGGDVLDALASDMSAGARLELARALMTGAGLPRAQALVPDILAPLIEGDGPEAGAAALLSAQALIGDDPELAYRHALLASRAGTGGVVSMLDALEGRMTTGAVLAAQDAFLQQAGARGDDALQDITDIRALRRLALAHFTGIGALRAYPLAYYYALIAEGAGDIGARTLREDIEARFAGRGPDVDALWSKLRADVQADALQSWIALDLAAQFAQPE